VNENIAAPGHLLEGKYEIVGVVGEGAWGLVLEGINIRIRRRVAIKILKAEYASRADMVSRFEREALASTHIESPHVVQVFDAGVLADGRPYLVMEFLTGDDLGTHIQLIERLPIVTAVDLCAQVARGLAAAHAAGVFHRDMKPTNIVIARTKSGREIAKIVDFGISKLLDTPAAQASHTQTGTVLGSPVYMSPEQARGSKASDHRSDLYSLGVVLFECLTGRPPHDAEGFNALLFKIALEPAPSVRSLRPEIDEELEEIVRRLLAKLPEERPQSALELEGLLNAWLRKRGVKLGETPTESGPRLLDGLTSSPIASFESLSSGKSSPSGLPNLEATVLLESAPNPVHATTIAVEGDVASIDGPGQLVPAPGASSPDLQDSSLVRTKLAAGMSAPPGRRLPMLAGIAALVLIIGVVAGLALRRHPSRASGLVSTDPTTEPLASHPGGGAGATAITSSLSAPGMSVDVTSAAAEPKSGASSPPVREPAGVHVPRPLVSSVPAGAAGSAKGMPSAVPTVDVQPAASATGSASVGGRTIRTEF
jgi:serine/threonine-protein kinase